MREFHLEYEHDTKHVAVVCSN